MFGTASNSALSVFSASVVMLLQNAEEASGGTSRTCQPLQGNKQCRFSARKGQLAIAAEEWRWADY
jgi:hypothetical protein